MVKKWAMYTWMAVILTLSLAIVARPAIQQIAGLAVAQTTARWNNVIDSSIGDAQPYGILGAGVYLWNGSSFDRLYGSAAGGANVTIVGGSVTIASSGNNFYAIEAANLGASSVNYAFGFTSKKVIIETPPTNTDQICVNWDGGTASCPSANTAGSDRILPGRVITLDFHAVTSVSAIANSGTQTVYIRAFN